MFETMRNAWKVKEIRKKILYTLLILIIFRIGSVITVPFLDMTVIQSWMDQQSSGNFLEYLNLLSGGSLSKATIFSLSIQPFINASIIMQLLTYALPPLERLQNEGEVGRKKLNQITAFVSLGLSVMMSAGYYFMLRNNAHAVKYTTDFSGYFAAAVIIVSFIAGSSIIVWMGNRINDKGIGNGISMILFAGIISRFPSMIGTLWSTFTSDKAKYLFVVPLVVIIFIAMITFIVWMNNSERRIPIQYAKRVVGRKQYGGQNTHIPVKVVMSGVMPIIFAMAFLSLPSTIQMFAGMPTKTSGFYYHFLKFFNYTSLTYALMYFILIIAFNYFYVFMMYNPVEIANNLRQNNGGVPGIRPGKPTAEYIKKVLSKITLVGAFFLGVIAIFPIIFAKMFPELQAISMGGTSILIIVSVALETVRTLESQMMMRHHKGFLE